MDLRKINCLIADDYTDNKHPVSTLSDAAQHLAGESLFCKLDCSQAYDCLQMVEQRLVGMLPFIFVSKKFAYKRLSQEISSSMCAFSSLIRDYIDPVVEADQCAQYVGNWECSQYSYGPYPEPSGSLHLHSSSSIENDNRKTPFSNQTSWLPWQTHRRPWNFKTFSTISGFLIRKV